MVTGARQQNLTAMRRGSLLRCARFPCFSSAEQQSVTQHSTAHLIHSWNTMDTSTALQVPVLAVQMTVDRALLEHHEVLGESARLVR